MNPAVARYADDPEKGPQSTDAFFARPHLGPPAYNEVDQLPNEIVQDHRRNVRRRRFWHFFACTFLFVTALQLLSQNSTANRLMGGIGLGGYENDRSQCSETVNWTKSSVERTREFPYHAKTSLTLPLSAFELFFVSEGSLQHGDFEVSQDLDSDSDDAVVNVDVFYRHSNALDDATVCRMHPSNSEERGLGIFTPTWRHPHAEHMLRFHIHLRLPAVNPDSILKINSLRTDLPLFSQHLAELADSAYFQRLRLHSTNAHIVADSVAGDTIAVQTNNGAIRGTFNTSTSLDLKTSNAPIDVHANLMNGDERPTFLSPKTSNGRIDSTIALASNTSDATRGKYDATARTSNAPLHLSFVDAPVDSSLTLDAHTSNSPAHVALHKTYEGTFDLSSSSFFRPEVQWTPVEDPAGRGRERRVQVEHLSRGHARGSVVWESSDGARGKVEVETSNSPLRLNL